MSKYLLIFKNKKYLTTMENMRLKNSKNESDTYSLKKIFKGTSLYSAGDILVNASNFFLIPLYTRVLTPADYGIVGYLQVFIQIATVIFAFGFYGAQTRYYFEHRDDAGAIGSFMYTINITAIIMFLFLSLPLVILGYLGKWTIGSESIPFHPFMTISIFTVLLSILNTNMVSSLQMKQNFLGATFVRVITFLFTTASTIIFILYYKQGAFGQIAGKALGSLFVFLIFYWIYAKQFIWKFSKDALKYALAFGFPIVIHLLMGTIHSSIDRLMLEHYLPISQLGIYTLASSVAMVLHMFVMAFNQAYQPSYYQLMDSGQDDTQKNIIQTFLFWLALITTATCIGIIFGGAFLSFFAGKQFNKVGEIFPYLLLSVYSGSFYFFFSSPIFYFKKTKFLPLITGSSALINIVLNFFLIPRYGILGASVATIISHIWISVISCMIGNRLFKVKWPFKYIVVSIVLVIGSFLISL